MRSKRFLLVMLLVLVHSFISCDGAAYHLQADVNHINSALSQSSDTDEGAGNVPITEIHAHQHCHSGNSHTSNHSITPEKSNPRLATCYNGLHYQPDVPPPNSLS